MNSIITREYIHHINHKDFFIALICTTNNITNKIKVNFYIENTREGYRMKASDDLLKKHRIYEFIKRETEIVKYKLRKEMGWGI